MQNQTWLAWGAAIFSAIAAIGGFWASVEAHRQVNISAGEANLETAVAIVRYCDVNTRGRMQSGDDIEELTGSTGDEDYITNMEQKELFGEVSKKPKHFLSCKLTNYGRVPVLNVTYYEWVTYHEGRTHKRQHNDDVIDALAPGESRTVWIVNMDNSAVVFHSPDDLKFYRFPDLDTIRDQHLTLDPTDYWILKRDADPVEHL